MFRLEDGKWARVGVVFNENERTISDLRVDGVVVKRSVINTKKKLVRLSMLTELMWKRLSMSTLTACGSGQGRTDVW